MAELERIKMEAEKLRAETLKIQRSHMVPMVELSGRTNRLNRSLS